MGNTHGACWESLATSKTSSIPQKQQVCNRLCKSGSDSQLWTGGTPRALGKQNRFNPRIHSGLEKAHPNFPSGTRCLQGSSHHSLQPSQGHPPEGTRLGTYQQTHSGPGSGRAQVGGDGDGADGSVGTQPPGGGVAGRGRTQRQPAGRPGRKESCCG